LFFAIRINAVIVPYTVAYVYTSLQKCVVVLHNSVVRFFRTSNQQFPKCGLLKVPRGSVDTFHNGYFEVYLFF